MESKVTTSHHDDSRNAHPIRFLTDTPQHCGIMFEKVRGLGYRELSLASMNDKEIAASRFRITVGRHLSETQVAELVVVLAEACASLGIDPARYAVEVKRQNKKLDITLIEAPFGACLAGRLRPYSALVPERFLIELAVDDDRVLGRAMEDDFRAAGFPVNKDRLDTEARGYTIDLPAVVDGTEVDEAIRHVMEKHITAAATDGSYHPIGHNVRSADDDTDVIRITAPLRSTRDGRQKNIVSNPTLFTLKIIAGARKPAAALRDRLATWGLAALTIEIKEGRSSSSLGRKPGIYFGRAGTEILERLKNLVSDLLGIDLVSVKAFKHYDTDIFVVLPDGVEARESHPPPSAARGVHRVAKRRDDRPYIHEAGEHLWVGGVALKRRATRDPRAPDPATFRHFCIDQSTANTLSFIAGGPPGEPTLLIGETGTGKTEVIRYLAARLGLGVMRVNLHGHTDNSELIGGVSPGPSGWRFQERALPTCLREGLILILDEINLSEPQTLERVNSVLEDPKSLELTEHDHRRFGTGGEEPVHPDFRMFATMNPSAGYAGRNALSPAFMNRWVATRVVPHSTEADVRALVRFLITGEEPDVEVDHVIYAGARRTDAPYGILGDCLPNLGAFIETLARFHAGAEAACIHPSDVPVIGGERPVITRRQLHATLKFLVHASSGTDGHCGSALWSAIERYYLDHVMKAETRDALYQLLAANGISPDGWRA